MALANNALIFRSALIFGITCSSSAVVPVHCVGLRGCPELLDEKVVLIRAYGQAKKGPVFR